MTKEYYKKLIDKYLEEDILMGTDKLQSISALYRSDSDINYDDGHYQKKEEDIKEFRLFLK